MELDVVVVQSFDVTLLVGNSRYYGGEVRAISLEVVTLVVEPQHNLRRAACRANLVSCYHLAVHQTLSQEIDILLALFTAHLLVIHKVIYIFEGDNRRRHTLDILRLAVGPSLAVCKVGEAHLIAVRIDGHILWREWSHLVCDIYHRSTLVEAILLLEWWALRHKHIVRVLRLTENVGYTAIEWVGMITALVVK